MVGNKNRIFANRFHQLRGKFGTSASRDHPDQLSVGDPYLAASFG